MNKALVSVLFAFASLFSVLSWAQEDTHSAEVCSASNAQVCAHLGHFKGFRVDQASEFVFHAMTPNQQELSDLQIVLWMPEHGHGSSPVVVKRFGVNKYQVTEAYFVMAGKWVVRATFKVAGQTHQLEIPVEISE